MIIFPEISSFLSSFDLTTVFQTGLAVGIPVLGFAAAKSADESDYDDESFDRGVDAAFSMEPEDESDYDDESFDREAAQARIAELERSSARSIEQNEELAGLYVALAIHLLEEGDALNDALNLFEKTEKILQATLSQGEDDEIRRQLGNLHLHRAVAYNDYAEYDPAIESYGFAIEVLKPLEDKGDGEAKYDIAGIRLNRGLIYQELGEFDNARSDFEESFLAFRAVEKISDLDTRYYMAKVSVAQGNLLHDIGEPLDKIADAYNRAMRLFVELIDVGQMEHERELANTLMLRCNATYEDYLGREYESQTEQLNKLGDVLIDVGRGIEILEKLSQGGDFENRFDLFSALTMEGTMLLDIGKNQEALQIFDRIMKEFADFPDNSDAFVLNQYASVVENRGVAAMNLGQTNESLADFNKAIEIREKFLSKEFGLDDDSRIVFQPSLATTFANRANAYATLGNLEQARKDGEHGFELIRELKTDEVADEFNEIEQIFETLLEQWK